MSKGDTSYNPINTKHSKSNDENIAALFGADPKADSKSFKNVDTHKHLPTNIQHTKNLSDGMNPAKSVAKIFSTSHDEEKQIEKFLQDKVFKVLQNHKLVLPKQNKVINQNELINQANNELLEMASQEEQQEAIGEEAQKSQQLARAKAMAVAQAQDLQQKAQAQEAEREQEMQRKKMEQKKSKKDSKAKSGLKMAVGGTPDLSFGSGGKLAAKITGGVTGGILVAGFGVTSFLLEVGNTTEVTPNADEINKAKANQSVQIDCGTDEECDAIKELFST